MWIFLNSNSSFQGSKVWKTLLKMLMYLSSWKTSQFFAKERKKERKKERRRRRRRRRRKEERKKERKKERNNNNNNNNNNNKRERKTRRRRLCQTRVTDTGVYTPQECLTVKIPTPVRLTTQIPFRTESDAASGIPKIVPFSTPHTRHLSPPPSCRICC